ncbi:TonB-dependent receptor [Spirosoma rhododendri]|uniref:TonB-dependent receptor n=1 Tax=Spirosoma rhododendri TaxID=2728024 RepID=A0A7L5DN30_9BACT|nr:TonB-dependent receptor [Spirosoma rhododendri]QJD78891.1 TonB-dependent receptor [Spirosoma rhododendri]
MRPLYVFLLLLIPLASLAQTPGTIRGSVVDSTTRKPLLEASVSLLSGRDSSLVTFGITDGDGRFTFTGVKEGNYRVLVSYLGYRSRARRVSVSADKPTADMGPFEMTGQANALTEVTVQGEKAPVAVKGDTLEFNAGSFKTQPNAIVEDLLKKLPGVEVATDGTVKAQGQQVSKVLIDGKPFFGNDAKMATRNLPADIIDKVQVFDQASEQSQFSGVDDGDREKTINITTKRDKRKGAFGQQSAGIGPRPGSDPRYSARATLNRFNDGQQISVLGMANNINQQGFTGQDLGLGSNFGGAGQGQGGGAGGGGNVIRAGGGGGGAGNGSGQVGNNAITQSWAAGINYRDGWGKKIDVVGSYNASNTNTLTNQTSRRDNILPTTTAGSTTRTDSAFVTNRANNSDNTNTNHRANLRLDYRLDSMTTIRVIPSLSWLNSTYQNNSDSRTFSGSGVPTNTSRTNYNSTGSGFTGNNTALIMHKFRKKGRTISLNWNTAINNQDNVGFNRSVNTFSRPNTPTSSTAVSTSAVSTSAISTSGTSGTANGGLYATNIDQRSQQRTESMTHSINLSYTEPLSMRQTLEFHYFLSNNRNTSDRAVFDRNAESQQYDLPNATLTNNFVNTYMTNRGGLTWQTNRLKYTYALGLDAQQATLRSDNLSRPADVPLNRTFSNLLPNALFTYNFAKNQRLRFNYRTRVNAPSVNQLQPVINNTNPLNIQVGNAGLQPEYSHNLNLNYNRFNPATFRSMFVFINASRTDNKIVNSTTFSNAGAQTTRPVNTDGYYTVNGSLALGRPLRFDEQRVNLNLSTNLTYNTGTSYINDQTNRSQNWLIGQSLGFNTNINDKLDVTLRGDITLQSAKYSLQPQQNTTFLNQTASLDLFYQLPFRFTFTSNVLFSHYGGSSSSFSQSFTLWNAALSRQLFKQKQGELRLSVFDLLNQNRSVVRNVTDTYVEEVQSQVLTQYFMVSFVYNLRRFVAGTNVPSSPFDQQNRGNRGNGGNRGFRRNE